MGPLPPSVRAADVTGGPLRRKPQGGWESWYEKSGWAAVGDEVRSVSRPRRGPEPTEERRRQGPLIVSV